MKLFGKLLELVILDFDGVVLDLMARYWEILEIVAQAHRLNPDSIQQYREGHYNGTRRGSPRIRGTVQELWPHLGDEAATACYLAFRAEEERTGYPPVPGSIETIRWLKERGVSVALCSMNDQRAMGWKLKMAELDVSSFDSVVTRERAGCDKPDPRIIDPIFSDVPVPKAKSVYVGDWYADIELCRAARVPFLAVLSGGIPRHAFIREGVPEDHIIGSLADLPKLITE